MRRGELAAAATPEAIAEYVGRGVPVPHEHGGPGAAMESVREATHRGHRIVVRTTYRIEVDDAPVSGHLAVGNDGRVHYHAMPTVDFASAVDLVRRLIDAFPEDFPAPGAGRSSPEPSGPEPSGPGPSGRLPRGRGGPGEQR